MTQYSNPPLNYICEGCLSADRKLSTIYDEQYKRIFMEMLDSLDHLNQQLLLCWECTAILRSVISFKKQVRTAHDCLIRYMVCQTTHISSLSNLKTTTCNTTQEYYKDLEYDDKTLVTPENGINPSFNSETTNTNFSNFINVPQISKVYSENNKDETAKDIVDGNESRPLFIKIEDNEFEYSEHFYEDENNSYEEKDDITEVKTDTIPTTQDSTTSKKGKSKKKKKKKEEFDASDDEPLKPKKEKRGRPKKEGTEEKSEKKRRSKREKPAGVVTNPRVHRNLEQLNVQDGQVEMVVLSWEEVEAERQKARESIVFTRHEYRCADCVLGFNHRFKLDNHMAKHSPTAGSAECPVCHVRCRDDHALVAHKRRHRVRWRCVSCGEQSSRAAVAADHAARAHGAAPTHKCRRCGLTLQSLAKLRNHMKNHAERQKCELCGKTFRDRTSLRTHLFIHRGEKEYSCPHCDKKFLFKKAMEVHLVTHAAPAQLYCHECDMTFKNRMSYYQHQKYNLKHIDPAKLKYQCPLCDKRFLKAARLEEHNFAVHLKVTPIRCTMTDCDFACSSRPVLRTHIRMIHRNARAARNHVCDTCGKAYTTKKTLEGHMRSHTGERPFHCALCSSTFSYEAALYNHNKLVHLKGKVSHAGDTCHTGERPFHCALCSSTFSYEAALYNHNKLVHLKGKVSYAGDTCHTGERPFHCALCSSTFSYEAALYNHNKLVHLKGKVSYAGDTCHTGERPFHCALCSSTFSYEAALYNHNKLVPLKGKVSHAGDTCHTGERPFHCALRSSTFSYEAALYNHNKLVHLKGKVSHAGDTSIPIGPTF